MIVNGYTETLSQRNFVMFYVIVSAVAYVRGNHFTTFDGEEFDFSGKCSYILARDFVDGNFSVIMNYLGNNKKQLVITTASQTLQIAPNGNVNIFTYLTYLTHIFFQLCM